MMARRRRSEADVLQHILDELDDLFNTLRGIEPADAESKRLLGRAKTRVHMLEDFLLNP
jgi:hypothetical protein